MNDETYRITVAVRKRKDADAPSSLIEALATVRILLSQESSPLTVLSVEQEVRGTQRDGQMKWG